MYLEGVYISLLYFHLLQFFLVSWRGWKYVYLLSKRWLRGGTLSFDALSFEFDALKGFLQVDHKAIQLPNLTGYHLNTWLAYSPIHCSIVFPLPCCFNRGFPQKSLAIKAFSLLPNGVTQFSIVRDGSPSKLKTSQIWHISNLTRNVLETFLKRHYFCDEKSFQFLITTC